MSHVQTAGPINSGGTTFVIVSLTAVASGNGVVGYGFAVITSGTPAISTILDDQSNSYVAADQVISGGNFYFQFYRVNITNGPKTITVTVSGGVLSSVSNAYWEEFTDLSSGKSLDAHSLLSVATATGTNGYKSGILTTQNVSEFVFTMAMQVSGAATLTAGTSPVFTASLVDNLNQFYSEFRTQTATTVQAVWTATDATSSFFLGLMTFGTLVSSTFVPRRQPTRTLIIPTLLRRGHHAEALHSSVH